MDNNLQKLITWSLDQLELADDLGLQINAIDAIVALCISDNGHFYAQPLIRLKKMLVASLNEEYSTMLDNVLIGIKETLHGGINDNKH